MAPPQAPLQAIRREAQATTAAAQDANPMRIDYGTELELPSAGQPAEPVAEAPRPIPLPRPSTALKRPGGPAPVPVPRGGVETAEANEPTETRVREIVVPVKLAPGARYEVVIRLQLDTTP
jgi:hypothetical protein